MHSHLDVQTLPRGEDIIVLAARGELDLASSELLESAIAAAIESAAAQVILDLRGLEFIDSVGISVLIRANQRLHDLGRRFGLVRGGAQVQRLLSLTGLDSRVSLGDTPEQLIAGG